MDRDAFLARIRDALERRPGAKPYADMRLSESPQDVACRARQALQRNAGQRQELLSRLASMAEKSAWKVARCPSTEEAMAYIRQVADGKHARRVVHTLHPVFQRLPLTTALPGLECVPLVQANGLTYEMLRLKADAADLGVTGVDFAIAETGTCVLLAGPGISRLPSLMPPTHIAIVEPEQVVATLDDVFLLRRLAYLQGERSSYMTFITGPSRTGDIEQTIIVGAHGPGEVHLLILG